MSKVKNNVACLGDAELMDMYPGAVVMNKQTEVDFSKILLSGQTEGNLLTLWGRSIGERKVNLGIRQDSALTFIAENINSSEELEKFSHVVIGDGGKYPGIYRLTRDNKMVIDVCWDWTDPNHKKSNWKKKRPSYTYPSLSGWERFQQWFNGFNLAGKVFILSYSILLFIVLVCSAQFFADENMIKRNNKILTEISLDRKCDKLFKLENASGNTSKVEVIGKDSIRITDNATHLGELQVVFSKNKYGEWVPGDGCEYLAYDEVERIVRQAYYDLIYIR